MNRVAFSAWAESLKLRAGLADVKKCNAARFPPSNITSNTNTHTHTNGQSMHHLFPPHKMIWWIFWWGNLINIDVRQVKKAENNEVCLVDCLTTLTLLEGFKNNRMPSHLSQTLSACPQTSHNVSLWNVSDDPFQWEIRDLVAVALSKCFMVVCL